MRWPYCNATFHSSRHRSYVCGGWCMQHRPNSWSGDAAPDGAACPADADPPAIEVVVYRIAVRVGLYSSANGASALGTAVTGRFACQLRVDGGGCLGIRRRRCVRDPGTRCSSLLSAMLIALAAHDAGRHSAALVRAAIGEDACLAQRHAWPSTGGAVMPRASPVVGRYAGQAQTRQVIDLRPAARRHDDAAGSSYCWDGGRGRLALPQPRPSHTISSPPSPHR